MNKEEEKVEQEEVVEETTVEENQEEQEVKADAVDEVQEAKDKYLRLYSEFENFRRRTAKEKLELISTANEGLILSLLMLIQLLQRSLLYPSNQACLQKYFQSKTMTLKQICHSMETSPSLIHVQSSSQRQLEQLRL